MVVGEFDDEFKLFTTAEFVIAAGALFKRLIIAALLFDLCVCVNPKFQKYNSINKSSQNSKFLQKL